MNPLEYAKKLLTQALQFLDTMTLRNVKEAGKQTYKISLEGAELVTIKGKQGDKGDEPSDERLTGLIEPLIPEPIKGDKGEDGKDSQVPGPQGVPGERGEDGSDGKDGADGKDGEKGENGKDGSPDLPEQIVQKLESLKGEKRLSIDAIKGIAAVLNSIPRGGQVGLKLGQMLQVLDEGTLITSATQSINFTGSGVNVTKTADGQVAVVITGGGGSGGGLLIEIPSGTQDGANQTFTVLNTPLWISVNGQELYENVDYTRSGLTLTLGTAPLVTDVLRSLYSGGSSGTQLETPSGTQDSINKTFIVSNTPVWITVNGQALFENAGYTRSGLTLTLDDAPASGDVLRSHY